MEDSIKAVDCVGNRQQSKAPGDARVLPTAEPLREVLEDELRRAALCQYRQGDDCGNEEYKVQGSAYKLKAKYEFTEPQVTDERHEDQQPHNQCRMPKFVYIVVVIKYGKASDDS